MGPERSSSSVKNKDLPHYHPTKALQKWLTDVSTFVDTAYTAIGMKIDRWYQTIFATLAMQLFDCGFSES